MGSERGRESPTAPRRGHRTTRRGLRAPSPHAPAAVAAVASSLVTGGAKTTAPAPLSEHHSYFGGRLPERAYARADGGGGDALQRPLVARRRLGPGLHPVSYTHLRAHE